MPIYIHITQFSQGQGYCPLSQFRINTLIYLSISAIIILLLHNKQNVSSLQDFSYISYNTLYMYQQYAFQSCYLSSYSGHALGPNQLAAIERWPDYTVITSVGSKVVGCYIHAGFTTLPVSLCTSTNFSESYGSTHTWLRFILLRNNTFSTCKHVQKAGRLPGYLGQSVQTLINTDTDTRSGPSDTI